MSEEEKTSENQTAEEVPAPKRKRRRLITLGVVAAVLVAAVCGFWVWHEHPSFCSTFCHTPMADFVEIYDQEPGQPGVDKWGNPVSNTSGMMAVTHRAEDYQCIDCHVPTLSQQINEVGVWLTGNYTVPMIERNGIQLCEDGLRDESNGDSFCMNESCHNISKDELAEMTADYDYNPHDYFTGNLKETQGHDMLHLQCTDCHKGHRASVNYCSQCHVRAPVPDGWITVEESKLDLDNDYTPIQHKRDSEHTGFGTDASASAH